MHIFKKIFKRFRSEDEKPKKIRKRKSKLNKVWIQWRTRLLRLLWFSLSAVFLIFLKLWYDYRFDNPDYEIKTINISQDSLLEYDNKEIRTGLSDYLVGKNYRKYTYNGKDNFDLYVQNAYPLIESIQTDFQQEQWVLDLEIYYHQPKLSVSNENNIRIIWKNKSYLTSNADGILDQTTELRLPAYTNSYTDLEGMFYHIHDETISTILDNISDILNTDEIVDIEYDPGGRKLHITYNNKLILFHLDKWLDEQLAKLLDISQYYSSYKNVTKIDLWSSDDIIVR